MPRTKKAPPQMCRNGHDTHAVGRNTEGMCRACCVVHQRRYSARRLVELHEYKRDKGCAICGYRRSAYALDLHHPDPSKKEFAIGRTLNKAKIAFWAEVEKCVVLCRNCHAEEHTEEKYAKIIEQNIVDPDVEAALIALKGSSC